MRSRSNDLATRVAERLAFPMFVLSLVFLALVAALIVVWVDIPRLDPAAESPVDVASVEQLDGSDTTADANQQLLRDQAFLELNAAHLGDLFLNALFIIWPIFLVEFLVKLVTHDRQHKNFWSNRISDAIICVCPPLRLATSNGAMSGQIWLPRLGWQQPGKKLSQKLERTFGKPMLTIALLILPILLIEFGLHNLVDRNFWLRLALHVCTGLIWCAFAVEFIIMVSATDKKFRYVKKNWIDLAIILLPLISFLRSLRVIRAAKMARFAKLQQLSKMTRIYRMRGLLAKALRALMLFEVVNRLIRNTPEKQLKRLKSQFIERSEELEELRQDIERLESMMERTDPPDSHDENGCTKNPNKPTAITNTGINTDSDNDKSDSSRAETNSDAT